RHGACQGGRSLVDQLKGNQYVDGDEDDDGENHCPTLEIDDAVQNDTAVDDTDALAVPGDVDFEMLMRGELEDDFQQRCALGQRHVILGHNVARHGGLVHLE